MEQQDQDGCHGVVEQQVHHVPVREVLPRRLRGPREQNQPHCERPLLHLERHAERVQDTIKTEVLAFTL